MIRPILRDTPAWAFIAVLALGKLRQQRGKLGGQ